MKKIAGMILCYNEEHILSECIEYYLSLGLDLYFFDNQSTDSSREIVTNYKKKLRQSSSNKTGKIIDIQTIETNGFAWREILKFCNDYMHRELSGYDWIFLIDADSFYLSKVIDFSLRGMIDDAEENGYNVLNGNLYHFYPTTIDDNKIVKHTERMKYFDLFDHNYNPVTQERIFKYHQSVDFVSGRGHVLSREDKRTSPIKFNYLHYNWVSFEHGIKKVIFERKARYISKELKGFHPLYNNLLPLSSDFVFDHKKLTYYNYKKEQYGKNQYKNLKIFIKIYSYWYKIYFKYQVFVFKYYKLLCGLLNSEIRRSFKSFLTFKIADKKRQLLWEKQYPKLFRKDRSNYANPVSLKTYVLQQVDNYESFNPYVFVFLVSRHCNANCFFCNQHGFLHEETSIDLFKQIISNIPRETIRTVIFSGGGEPLLCKDLFKMIDYLKSTIPWAIIVIRTNGFALEKFVENFTNSHIVDRIEISWHGSGAKEDREYFGREGFENKVAAVKRLTEIIQEKKLKTKVALYAVLFRENIDELPTMVRNAHSMGADEMNSTFAKYYVSRKNDKKNWDMLSKSSLYYFPQKYCEIIALAKREAKNYGIIFSAPVMDLKGEKSISRCRNPWAKMLIEHDGTVYPCPGGEVQFRNKVERGELNFGNLAKDHLHKCLALESYTMLRRTLRGDSNECFVKECDRCCMSGEFKGHGHKDAHFI